MCVYLHPNQPTRATVYSPAVSEKPAQNTLQIRRIYKRSDENAMPALNGSPNQSELHKFVPENQPPQLSLMHDALKNGEVARAWECIKKNTYSPSIVADSSTLVLAIQNCSKDKLLIDHFISCTQPGAINNTTDTTALIEAATLLDQDLVQRLLEKRANPNLCTPLHATPLNCAIRSAGRIIPGESEECESVAEQVKTKNEQLFAIVQTLLEYGAYADSAETLGVRPLQTLFNNFFPEARLVTLLIANGANPVGIEWENQSEKCADEIRTAIFKGLALNKDRIAKLGNSNRQATSSHTWQNFLKGS